MRRGRDGREEKKGEKREGEGRGGEKRGEGRKKNGEGNGKSGNRREGRKRICELEDKNDKNVGFLPYGMTIFKRLIVTEVGPFLYIIFF